MLTNHQREMVLDLLWEDLRKDKEYEDRVHTGWGTKTEIGLIACIDRIMQEKEE